MPLFSYKTIQSIKYGSIGVRIRHYGCDLITLDNVSNPRSLLTNPLIAHPKTAGQFIVRTKNGKFYYVNKHEGIAQEIHLNVVDIPTSDCSLGLEKTQEIAGAVNIPHLYTRAQKVIDIEVSLTAEQRRQALMHLDDSKINFKSTAYTYAFQGYIAKFMGESWHDEQELVAEIEADKQSSGSKPLWRRLFAKNKQAKLDKIREMRKFAEDLHKLSATFKDLECYINNAVGDPKILVGNFSDAITANYNAITAQISEMSEGLNDDEPRKILLDKLQAKITKNYNWYDNHITRIKKHPNADDLDCLLSIADRAFTIKSLGTYMREQMSCILDMGIKTAYKISDNRLKDVIQVPRLVAYLSDAEHLMLIKGQSIVEGPKDNDTYSPIPEEMLAAITAAEPITGDAKKWFSLKPYLKKWYPSYIDETLCLLAGKSRAANNLHGNKLYHFGVQPLKIIASVVEIAFAIPRLLIVAALGVTEVSLSVIPFFKKPNSQKLTWKLNQYLSRLYDSCAFVLAPLSFMQRLEINQYKRTDGVDDEQQQVIIDTCADYTTYCHKFFVYFTPQLITIWVQDFFASVIASITNFFADLRYLLTPSSANEQVYVKVKHRQHVLKVVAKALDEVVEKRHFDEAEAERIKEYYANVEYCKENGISSPLDVFYEIAVVLSNDVVNPMFRKSPGIATFYFALSMLTFGTFVLPASSFAWMRPFPGWLQYLANQISIHFTGKPTSAGMMEQMIACFLGWKLGFFTTEFVAEMAEGHYEILEKLFEEPEKIVFGLVGLVGIGMALQYIPELPTSLKIPVIGRVPNLYFMVINTFTEEAKCCADGTYGLTAIEYGFLGLKFVMLFHSMVAGSEHLEEEKGELRALVKFLDEKKLLNDIVSAFRRKDGDPDDAFDWFQNPPGVGAVKDKISQSLGKSFAKYSDETIQVVAQSLINEALDAQKVLNENHQYKGMVEDLYKNQATSVKSKKAPTFAEAKAALLEAIQMCEDGKHLSFSPSAFGVSKEAHQVYDHLDKLFDEYNDAAMGEYNGENHLLINKRPYLDIFFNRYIYRRSNNFVRSFLLILYPIPLVSRSLKYLWATLTNKPSMKHQIVKNFCKDVVIVSQVFTPVARMAADFNMYISGVLRGVAFATVTPLAALVYSFVQVGAYLRGKERTPFSKWFAVIDENICKYIALHKTPALQPLRQLIVRAARVAGTNTDLQSAGIKVEKQLGAVLPTGGSTANVLSVAGFGVASSHLEGGPRFTRDDELSPGGELSQSDGLSQDKVRDLSHNLMFSCR